MKVLVDCAPLSMGGGVQVAIALLMNLQTRPDISWRAVLSEQMREAGGPELATDPRVLFVWKRSWADFILLHSKLRAVERVFEPDVVFTVFGPTYFISKAPHLMGFALPNLIYNADGPQTARSRNEKLADQMRGFLFRRASHLVVETETVRRRLASRAGIDASRISVIGNSVNPVLLTFEVTAAPIAGPFVILIPSAYYRHKNLQIVPRIAAELARLNPELDFVFRLTLASQSEPWRGIAADAERLGVGGQVATLGPLPLAELAVAYGHASAVLLPTLREASTAVYPEAFHMQRPLVTSDIDFARELCGEAALFADPRDPAAYAKALDRLACEGVLRERLVMAGKQQLSKGYPSATDKFFMQMDLFEAVARGTLVGTKTRQGDLATAICEANAGADKNAAISFHETLAEGWDAKYKTGGFKRRERFFRSNILPLIKPKGRWLDAGCGSGYFARILASEGVSVLGVDASEGMIRSARDEAKRAQCPGDLQFQVVEDLVPLALDGGSMAGCLCLSVIEYLAEPVRFLDEVARVLAPGGALVISVPNSRSLVRALQVDTIAGALFGGARRWRYRSLSRFSATKSEFSKMLTDRGLAVKSVLDFDPVLPGPLARFIPASLMFFVAEKRSA